MHHFDGTAGETEGHGPKGTLARPVGDLIEGGAVGLSVIHVHIHFCPRPTSKSPDSNPGDLTYSAYCIAPFFPSWLGSGTSRRAAFMGGGVPGLPATRPGLCIGAAGFDEEFDRKATLPARYGRSAVIGFAVQFVSSETKTRERVRGDGPRRAIEAADRVVDSIAATNTKESCREGVETSTVLVAMRGEQ